MSKNWTFRKLAMASTNFQSAMPNFTGVVRNRWLERTTASEEREEFWPVLVSFQLINCPSNHICKGRRLADMGTFKPFMVRAMFMGADRRLFFDQNHIVVRFL
jgi:hypothetical protein